MFMHTSKLFMKSHLSCCWVRRDSRVLNCNSSASFVCAFAKCLAQLKTIWEASGHDYSPQVDKLLLFLIQF